MGLGPLASGGCTVTRPGPRVTGPRPVLPAAGPADAVEGRSPSQAATHALRSPRSGGRPAERSCVPVGGRGAGCRAWV